MTIEESFNISKFEVRNNFMRYFFLILTFTLFSCSTDGDEVKQQVTKEDLLGVWKIQTYTFGGVDQPLNDCNEQGKLTFVSDDLILTRGFYDNDECVVFDVELEYSISGDSIIIDNSGMGDFRFYATILDENTIRLEQTYHDSEASKILKIYKRPSILLQEN